MLRQTFVKKFCLQRTTTYTRAQKCWHTYSRNFDALSTNWQKNFLKIMSLSVTQNYSSTPIIFTSNRLCSIRRPFLAADDSTTMAVILPSLNMNPMWPVESLWSVKVLSNGLKKRSKSLKSWIFQQIVQNFLLVVHSSRNGLRFGLNVIFMYVGFTVKHISGLHLQSIEIQIIKY